VFIAAKIVRCIGREGSMNIELPVLAMFLSITTLIVTLVNAAYTRKRDTVADVVKLTERIVKLEATADYSWKMIEMYAGKILHHPTTPTIDYFIDKNEEGHLTHEEAEKFANIIKNIITDGDNDGRKAAATLMLAAIARRYKLKLH